MSRAYQRNGYSHEMMDFYNEKHPYSSKHHPINKPIAKYIGDLGDMRRLYDYSEGARQREIGKHPMSSAAKMLYDANFRNK